MRKRRYRVVWLLVLLLLLSACGRQEVEESGDAYNIYELNKEETKVVSRTIYTDETSADQLLELLIDELESTPENTELRAAIPDSVTLESCSIAEENVTLNFGTDYSNLGATAEVLTRAAIVRTLTQIEGVRYVTFLVDGAPLLNKTGKTVGIMTADQFIDNSGNEINTEEKVSLCLFFADEEGEKLIQVNREVVYSSNISLEKLVMEQLIAGVNKDEEAYPTMNPDTKIVSVTVRDGTCYVNLDETFLTQIYNASAEVTIYSVVNSLVELSDVNRVQISVNGETNISYKEIMPLGDTFERNLELIQTQ